ncbi:MAG: alginate export family protein [Pirellulaceae bacterium]|jgi:hypothetical protein|nr:alginate export family protein [Pirellulaceae bacterium]MDP7016317.1 alginate export family protein [Pirellulaceae bacterium]
MRNGLFACTLCMCMLSAFINTAFINSATAQTSATDEKPTSTTALSSSAISASIGDDAVKPASQSSRKDAAQKDAGQQDVAQKGDEPGCSCKALACDCAKGKALGGAVKGAYKGVFYDNRFDYLCDPCYDDWHLGESFKRMSIAPWATLDLGGEYRIRWHNEHNMRTRPLSGASDDFLLQRLRLYSNLELGDRFRIYGEAVDASITGNVFPARGIEVNRFDAINLFADMTVWDDCCASLDVRVGRQELQYGVQRLIAPLDWGNTRRTWDGVKGLWNGPNWAIDAFWTRPVTFGQHLPHDRNFDHPDNSQEFIGVYGTRQGVVGGNLDVYFLRFDENDQTAVRGEDAMLGGFDANTFGARYTKKHGGWQFEAEGGYQFGRFANDSTSAGFFTIGLGKSFDCMPFKPLVTGYYDWASGDSDPTDQQHQTFHQYYPLGHKYFGFMDIVGRQNITDANLLTILHTTERSKVLIWYHAFNLQQARDALYNAGGAPIYRDATGASGGWIGQELDLALVVTPTPRTNVTFGYSHFWGGSYFQSATIVPAAASPSADFFFIQATVRF